MENTNIKETFIRLFDKDKIQEEIKQGHINWLNSEHNNPNNFSYWSMKMGNLLDPYIVFKLPDWMLTAYMGENMSDKDNIIEYFAKNITPIVQSMFPSGECFMKNGCYSGKFNFNQCCHLTDLSNENIVNHFLNIEWDALMYETLGDLEVVFRAYIKPKDNCPTIYGGMPLRNELRAFYDFDKHKYLYDVFYWDWDYCHDRISDIEDVVTYEENYEEIEDQYKNSREAIRKYLEDVLQDIILTGKWSVDILIDENYKFHIIDMAIAEKSAYWCEDYEKDLKYL